MALKRAYHLSLRLKRESLVKVGQTLYGQFFTVVSAPSLDSLTAPRLAIIVSKKTATLASDRNKIKRTTSSLLQKLLPSLPAKDYLVIPKKQLLQTNYQLLESDLSRLVK